MVYLKWQWTKKQWCQVTGKWVLMCTSSDNGSQQSSGNLITGKLR